jgi:peptide/nickel transport system substrate-binding protein
MMCERPPAGRAGSPPLQGESKSRKSNDVLSPWYRGRAGPEGRTRPGEASRKAGRGSLIQARSFWWLLCIFLSLTGCTTRTSADPDVITVALDQPPTNLDPRIGVDASSERFAQIIFSSLVRKDEHSAIQPDVAESWEIPDPKTYIFHLRHDVKFHDGRPLTSKDVVFTFRSILDRSVQTPKLGTYERVQSVEGPNAHTVVFHLKEVFAPFLWNLSDGAIGIIPDGSGSDFSRHPIGSGPFAFVHYLQDQEVVLRRNENYFGTKAGVAILRFKIIPEAVVAALELRKGSVDIALNVLTPDMDETVKKDHDLVVVEAEGTNYQYIAFNLTDRVFRDLRVRQAVAYAIDRESIIKYIWRGEGRLATGVLPPENWAYEPHVKTYPYDPGRAKDLLRQAGYPDLSFTFRTTNEDVSRLMAAAFQQQLKEVGMTMDIRATETATFFADAVAGNFQMYSARWVGGNDDPDFLNLVFHSKMMPLKGANRGHYSNPRVDELIDFARRELDMEKRKQAYQEIQRIVAEELPYVSLFYRNNVCVYNKRIENVKIYPDANWTYLTSIRVHSL